MKKSLFDKHPFLRTLAKLAAVIIVSFGTFLLSVMTLFFFISILSVASSFSADDLDNPLPVSYRYVFGDRESENKLLVIPVSGVILGGKDSADPLSFLDIGVTYGYGVKQQLYDAVEDETIKGIVIEMNSPGGTIFGSRAIADGITFYKERTGNPVFSVVSGLGASGGYYAIVPSDMIATDYGSTVGSIGVITGPFKYYDSVVSEDQGAFIGGVVTQNGIDTTYITAGTSKDLGNPYRQLTDEEREVLQRGVNNEYDQFVSFVSTHREITEDVLRNDIGALIYDNRTAEELGLVDRTMNKEDSYRELASRLELGEDFVVIKEKTELSFFDSLLQAVAPEDQTYSTAVCPLSSSILAYHGNVSDLCRN